MLCHIYSKPIWCQRYIQQDTKEKVRSWVSSFMPAQRLLHVTWHQVNLWRKISGSLQLLLKCYSFTYPPVCVSIYSFKCVATLRQWWEDESASNMQHEDETAVTVQPPCESVDKHIGTVTGLCACQHSRGSWVIFRPHSDVLVQMLRPKYRWVSRQVVKIVHDDSYEQVQHLRTQSLSSLDSHQPNYDGQQHSPCHVVYDQEADACVTLSMQSLDMSHRQICVSSVFGQVHI